MELDAILGHRPASVPPVLLDTGACNSGTLNTTAESQEIPSFQEGECNGKTYNTISTGSKNIIYDSVELSIIATQTS